MIVRAIKSIKQQIPYNSDVAEMSETFHKMVNHCIRIGLKHNCSTLKRLSILSYHELQDYDILSSYKLNAISQACGRLSQMKQSIKRGKKTRSPFVRKPYLVNCYGFKINGCMISIPYRQRNPINLILNEYTIKTIEGLKVRSFTITQDSLILCVSKEVDHIKCNGIIGIDRNLRNVTCGNQESVTFYKTNKLLSIRNNTIHARAGFKRNDRRKKVAWYKKMQRRLQKRTQQYIHKISKDIVGSAVKNRTAIAFENLKGIRKLYRKGNSQGKRYRGRLNSWPFYELQRQVEYKARWEGIPVVCVNPKCTSKLCPACGKRIQEDKHNRRKLWCSNCMRMMDRDVVASLNISYKAWPGFSHARGDTGEGQSSAFEEQMSEPKLLNYDSLAIRILDVSKSGSR